MAPSWMFASDNTSGVHPEIIEALARANEGTTPSYGADELMESVENRFRQQFGDQSKAYLVYNGTAANVLSLKAMTQRHHAVLCTDSSHIHVDECGAPEIVAGCKLLPIEAADGKLTPAMLTPYLATQGDQHHVQARVVSISQVSEVGTTYTPGEIRSLAEFAHSNGMLLHMDGARIANAAAHLGLTLKQITADCGVDVLSCGGTKNGAMGAEAVVLMNASQFADFKYIRKQGMQLASKMRFLAAQFDALFTDNLWLSSARHANEMAGLLAKSVSKLPGVTIQHPLGGNAVFARIPAYANELIWQTHKYYVWEHDENIVRWMTSFNTTEADVAGFVAAIETALRRKE